MFYMEMYNSKRELVDLQGYTYLDEGECAKVFRKGDEVFKLYKFDTKYYFFLGTKMFKVLKEIDDPNIVKLYDYFYYYDDFLTRHSYMDGYSMQYVERDEDLVIDKPSEYLFSIADQLDGTVERLSERKIHIRDYKYRNIIFGKDKATLIDVDTYEFCPFTSYETLKKANQEEMLRFLTSQLIHELRQDDMRYWLACNDLNRLPTNMNMKLRDILGFVITEDTPRKSMEKSKRLYIK